MAQSQGVTFGIDGSVAVLASSEQSASSVLGFTQDLAVRNGRGVVGAAGEATDSVTHEEGTTTAFTKYVTSSALAADGSRVDLVTYQDDAHTVSTHATTVDFGQWQLDDETFAHQHSAGDLDDERNLFDSRETVTAAGTGAETVTVEKYRHYRTDDDSTDTGLDAQQAGSLFVPLGHRRGRLMAVGQCGSLFTTLAGMNISGCRRHNAAPPPRGPHRDRRL